MLCVDWSMCSGEALRAGEGEAAALLPGGVGGTAGTLSDRHLGTVRLHVPQVAGVPTGRQPWLLHRLCRADCLAPCR